MPLCKTFQLAQESTLPVGLDMLVLQSMTSGNSSPSTISTDLCSKASPNEGNDRGRHCCRCTALALLWSVPLWWVPLWSVPLWWVPLWSVPLWWVPLWWVPLSWALLLLVLLWKPQNHNIEQQSSGHH